MTGKLEHARKREFVCLLPAETEVTTYTTIVDFWFGSWTLTALVSQLRTLYKPQLYFHTIRRRVSSRVLLEKLGGGVRPTSKKALSYLWYSLTYLWPDQKFKPIFNTWPFNQIPVSEQRYNKFPSSDQCYLAVKIICEVFSLIFFSIMMKKRLLLLKNTPISRL